MSVQEAGPSWVRSARCNSASCVEVAKIGDDVAVRDSKNPDGPTLRFSMDEWTAFLDGAQDGEFRFN